MSPTEVLRLGVSAEVRFQRSLAPVDTPGSPRSSGTFPLRWLDLDGAARAVGLPVGPDEGLWLSLRSEEPTALQVIADGRNALGGGDGSTLCPDPQDYVVIPEQRWVDGVRCDDGTVAPIRGPMAASQGVSSLRLIARRLRAAEFARWWETTDQDSRVNHFGLGAPVSGGAGAGSLGSPRAAPDPHGTGAWDPDPFAVVEVRLVDPSAW